MNSENNKKEDAQTDGHPLAEFIIIYWLKNDFPVQRYIVIL